MRRAHYLKPNKGRRIEHYWLFFDTESNIEQIDDYTQKHTYRLGYAIYVTLNTDLSIRCRTDRELWDRDDLRKFIYQILVPGKTLHVVAHNIGYDLQTTGLLNELVKDGFTITFMYLKEPTLIVKLHKGKLRLSLEDGYNRLRGTIAEWGDKLGLPKLGVDFATVDDQALIVYCKRDTEILLQATLEYMRFIKEHDLGNVKYTISSQALTAYKHRFMRHKILVHDNEYVLNLEREAYGGGMVRVFRVGHFEDDTYYLLDVNSMYGYVMREFEYPTRIIGYRKDVPLDLLEKTLKVACVIARCRVKPKRAAYRCYHLGKITYPLAEFIGVFTTEELKMLLEEGGILEIIEACAYTKRYLFTEYVEYFWNLRKKAIEAKDNITKALAKQYLNSLYGKFGARATTYRIAEEALVSPFRVDAIYTQDGKKRYPVIWIGDKPYVEQDEGEADDSIPAIAAHVTANARVVLWRYVELAGVENVYYTDTDSLIVNQAGYERLAGDITDNELGKLKLEKQAHTLTVYARKDYQIGDKVVCKGVGKSFLIPGATEYKREQWNSFRSYLKGLGLPEVLVEVKDLELKRECYDGEVYPDGRVMPFETLPVYWG